MKLTVKQCDLLLNMFNASINMAKQSGIPIGKEFYNDIDIIKRKLYQEHDRAISQEYYEEKDFKI